MGQLSSAVETRLVRKIEYRGSAVVKGRRFEGLRPYHDLQDVGLKTDFSLYQELLIVDVMSSVFGLQNTVEKLEKLLSEITIPVTFEGGIRTLDDAKRVFDQGVERVGINSALFKNIDLIDEVALRYGSQAVLASVSVRNRGTASPVMSEYGREVTGQTLESWLSILSNTSPGEILITSIDRDGTKNGLDLELAKTARRYWSGNLMLAGGLSSLEEYQSLGQYNEYVDAVVGSRCFLDLE